MTGACGSVGNVTVRGSWGSANGLCGVLGLKPRATGVGVSDADSHCKGWRGCGTASSVWKVELAGATRPNREGAAGAASPACTEQTQLPNHKRQKPTLPQRRDHFKTFIHPVKPAGNAFPAAGGNRDSSAKKVAREEGKRRNLNQPCTWQEISFSGAVACPALRAKLYAKMRPSATGITASSHSNWRPNCR